MRDEKERILDILEAIERIQKYAAKGRDAFEHDELIQNWIVHHLQVIGEAAANISEEFTNTHPEIPWQKIIGMRNILVHHYFGIDLNVVWSAVENDLPLLEKKLKKTV
jgi:uncharacterized protein with HEPN domain